MVTVWLHCVRKETPLSSNPDKTWHALLDEICLDQGHVDNVKLASDLCDLGKNAAPGAFDSALKSLAHWRDGKHTPNRRNFRLLTQILMIDNQSTRADEWRTLYEQALRRKPSGEHASMETQPMRANGAPEAAVTPRRSRKFVARYATMAGLVVFLGLGVLVFSEAGPIRGGDDGRITTLPVDMTGLQIYYRAPRFLTVFATTQRRALCELGWSWSADGVLPLKGLGSTPFTFRFSCHVGGSARWSTR